MFHENDDNLPEAVNELMGRAGKELAEALLGIGVHLDGQYVAADASDGNLQVGLIAQGWVGELAFADDVLHPLAAHDREVVADIDEATVEEQYQSIRRRLLGEQ